MNIIPSSPVDNFLLILGDISCLKELIGDVNNLAKKRDLYLLLNACLTHMHRVVSNCFCLWSLDPSKSRQLHAYPLTLLRSVLKCFLTIETLLDDHTSNSIPVLVILSLQLLSFTLPPFCFLYSTSFYQMFYI